MSAAHHTFQSLTPLRQRKRHAHRTHKPANPTQTSEPHPGASKIPLNSMVAEVAATDAHASVQHPLVTAHAHATTVLTLASQPLELKTQSPIPVHTHTFTHTLTNHLTITPTAYVTTHTISSTHSLPHTLQPRYHPSTPAPHTTPRLTGSNPSWCADHCQL